MGAREFELKKFLDSVNEYSLNELKDETLDLLKTTAKGGSVNVCTLELGMCEIGKYHPVGGDVTPKCDWSAELVRGVIEKVVIPLKKEAQARKKKIVLEDLRARIKTFLENKNAKSPTLQLEKDSEVHSKFTSKALRNLVVRHDIKGIGCTDKALKSKEMGLMKTWVRQYLCSRIPLQVYFEKSGIEDWQMKQVLGRYKHGTENHWATGLHATIVQKLFFDKEKKIWMVEMRDSFAQGTDSNPNASKTLIPLEHLICRTRMMKGLLSPADKMRLTSNYPNLPLKPQNKGEASLYIGQGVDIDSASLTKKLDQVQSLLKNRDRLEAEDEVIRMHAN